MDCGFVVDKVVYSKPEWRAYSYGDRVRRERAGAPITPLLHDFGLSTSPSAQRITQRKGDKFTIRILSEIYRISSSLNLPETVAQTAAILFRRIGEDFRKSRKLSRALPASLLHLSLKIHGIPRSSKELAKFSKASSSEILRCSMRLAGFLGVKEEIDIGVYVSKIVKELGANGEVESAANKLCEEASVSGLSQGRIKRAIAAASVYLAAKSLGFKVSQRRLAEVAGIGLSTLKRRLKELDRLDAIKI